MGRSSRAPIHAACRAMRWGADLAALLLLAGCGGCPAGLVPAVSAEIFFGAARPEGGLVTEAEWQDFLARTVSPAFPDGLTVLPAQGQWRDADGQVQHEETRVLRLLLPEPAAAPRLSAMAEAYRGRFRQESVLLVQQPACLAFIR